MTTVLDRTRDALAVSAVKTTPRVRLPRPKPVTVNGVVISRRDIGSETQHHPAATPIDAWLAAARALVVRELLLQEARRLGLVPAPMTDGEGRRETDDEALVRQLIEREVVTPEPDQAACRRIYEQRRQNFRSADLYAVRHILIAAPSADPTARAAAKEQAEALIEALTVDPTIFSDLAATYSACQSKKHGGALGQVSRGQTVPEFEAALADAPVGAVMVQPVETRYGFHVIILDQKIEGEQLPFELVQTRIASWLAQRSQETASRQYIAMLAGRAAITGIDLEAATSPLAQ
jgi:peptidyl-prolyl cis-trans isomerase C